MLCKSNKKNYFLKQFLTFFQLLLINQGNVENVALVDVSKIYGVPISQMSRMAIFYSGGYLIGTLGGFLFTYFNRQFLMGFFTLTTSIFNTFVPYYRPFWVAILAKTLTGLGLGVYMSGYQAWLIDMTSGMHEGADGTVMIASQACYGIGMFFILKINKITTFYLTI